MGSAQLAYRHRPSVNAKFMFQPLNIPMPIICIKWFCNADGFSHLAVAMWSLHYFSSIFLTKCCEYLLFSIVTYSFVRSFFFFILLLSSHLNRTYTLFFLLHFYCNLFITAIYYSLGDFMFASLLFLCMRIWLNKYAVRKMILITLLCECCCCCWGVLRLKQTVLFLPASHEPLFYPHSMCRSQLNDKQCGWWWWISDRFFFHRFISSSLDDLVSLFPHTKHRKNRAITMHALSHPMTLLVCVRA